MRRLLPLLLLFSFAAVAETPLGLIQHGPGSDDQFGPALASNGDGFLAVWTDNRSRERETWATRLDRDGNVLDPTGIRVSTHEPAETFAIWTGTSYLVVWSRRQNPDLWGARIDREGVLVDGPRVILQDARPSSLTGAANGTHVVIGYVREGFDVHALFLTPDAEVVNDLILAQDFRPHGGPSIVRSGSHFTAVWNTLDTSSSVDAVRFTVAGPIEPARRLPVDGFTGVPKLATDGSDFVLVARSNESGGPFAVRSVSGDLATVGAATALPEAVEYSAAIVWAGSHYILVGESGPLHALRVDRQGRLLDANPVTIEQAQLRVSGTPALATNGQTVLVGWAGAFEFFKPSGYDVYATRIDPNTLARTARTLVSTSVLRESDPVLATGTANVLAVWSDDAGILARRMRKDGSPLDATPLRLAETSTERPVPRAVAFNGTDYVAAWIEGTDLVTRRIRHDGELRADGGGRIAAGTATINAIAAASDGTTTLLVWGGSGLHAARVGTGGAIVDANPLTIVDKQIGSLDVAANDRGQFLVAWGELELLPPTFETYLPMRVRAARITTTLTNLDGTGFDVADTTAFEAEPAVAWNGREWFVVWTEGRTSVRGRRVAVNGTLDGGDVFVAGEASRPDIVWDGFRYVISWVAPNALRVGGHVVGLPTRRLRSPSLAAVGPGQVMAAYTRIPDEPELGGVERAFARVLGPPPKRRAARF
jgi:hypothetical protein